MIHPIVKYGDPVLETPTKPVAKFDDEFRSLVADMFESMYAAQGVGLAAPQIGIGQRVTVNFEHAGKQLINAAVVELLPVEDGSPRR